MRRHSTASALSVRLLLVATIVTQATPLPLYANAANTYGTEALTQTDTPALPSSFYGTVTLDGADVAEGTVVSAWLDGVQVAEAGTTTAATRSVYVLDVPGDDPQTPALDGGYEGAVVVFKVAGYAAGDLALWHAGEVVELDLSAIQHDGPDLAVLVDDEQKETFSGETLTYKIVVLNIGNQEATGVSIADTLPEYVTFVAADQGGSEAGVVVTWPTFSLAADAFTIRSVNVVVGNPLSVGVDEIENGVTVADDGAGGADPTPANNSSTDADTVAVAPALAARMGELSSCDADNPVLPPIADFLVSSVRAIEEGCRAEPSPGFSTQARDRVASAVRALAYELADSPLITADDDLLVVADAIESHTGCGLAFVSDLVALQDGLTEVQAQVCGIARHSGSVAFNPGSTYALAGNPATYELVVRNTGTDATTYDVDLQSLDPQLEVTGSPSSFSVPLASGDVFTASVVATPSAVGTFSMRVDVAAQEAPIFQAQATAVLRSLDSLVEVVEVGAEPPFVESGAGVPVTLYARIGNRTQVELPAVAHVQVLGTSGALVFSGTSSVSLEGVDVPIRYSLDTIDTAGFGDGTYTGEGA